MSQWRFELSLEPAAQAFVDATSEPPFLYQLPPEEGRKIVDSVQDSPIFKPEVDEEWVTVDGGPTGSVRARIVKPRGATDTLPVIVYTHGAGWVFDDAHTHDRLVRDLATGVGAALCSPNTTGHPRCATWWPTSSPTAWRSGFRSRAGPMASTRPARIGSRACRFPRPLTDKDHP